MWVTDRIRGGLTSSAGARGGAKARVDLRASITMEVGLGYERAEGKAKNSV